MRVFFILLLLVCALGLRTNAQSLVVQYGNEDRSLGANISLPLLTNGLGLVGGFKSGKWRGEGYKIGHKRILAGLSLEKREGIFGSPEQRNLLLGLYAAVAIHRNKKYYNTNSALDDSRFKKYSLEIGAHAKIPKSAFLVGFYYDWGYNEGGFSIGILL